MQISLKLVRTAAIVATLFSTVGVANADSGLENAIKARKSLMTLYAINLGQLAGMAKSKIDYDAEKAKTAAINIRDLATMNNSVVWPQGSDSTAMPGKTRAKLEAWTTYPASAERQKALIEAAAAMAETAGGGLGSIQAGLGAIGAACSACHKDYREP